MLDLTDTYVYSFYISSELPDLLIKTAAIFTYEFFITILIWNFINFLHWIQWVYCYFHYLFG